jgi:hypothetical protein
VTGRKNRRQPVTAVPVKNDVQQWVPYGS